MTIRIGNLDLEINTRYRRTRRNTRRSAGVARAGVAPDLAVSAGVVCAVVTLWAAALQLIAGGAL